MFKFISLWVCVFGFVSSQSQAAFDVTSGKSLEKIIVTKIEGTDRIKFSYLDPFAKVQEIGNQTKGYSKKQLEDQAIQERNEMYYAGCGDAVAVVALAFTGFYGGVYLGGTWATSAAIGGGEYGSMAISFLGSAGGGIVGGGVGGGSAGTIIHFIDSINVKVQYLQHKILNDKVIHDIDYQWDSETFTLAEFAEQLKVVLAKIDQK